LSNYLLRKKIPAEYMLRDGHRLSDGTGTLAGTIAAVFIRREYGLVHSFRTIIDIGANMGCFAVYAALQSPEARIYCYEPEQRNFGFLMRNIEINALAPRVSARQCAVASSAGPRQLVLGESPTNSLVHVDKSVGQQLVSCTTLKDIIADNRLDNVGLLKVNCEGAEYEILESFPAAEFSRISNIRLEYHNLPAPGKNGKSLARFLEARDYRIQHYTWYPDGSGFIWATRA
jgi:FkbM family methyltransferase